jgi:hypothetical protein
VKKGRIKNEPPFHCSFCRQGLRRAAILQEAAARLYVRKKNLKDSDAGTGEFCAM